MFVLLFPFNLDHVPRRHACEVLPRYLFIGWILLGVVNLDEAHFALGFDGVKNGEGIAISNALDLALMRLRVQGKARHEERDYEDDFHGRTL